MAKNFDMQGWAIVGAIVGVLTPIILWLAAKLPSVRLTFAVIDINIREKVTQNLITGSFAQWLQGFLGISFTLPGIVMGAISGILLVVGARWLLTFLPSEPKGVVKLMSVIFIALLAEVLLLNAFGIPTFQAIFGFAIAAVVVGLIVNVIYEQLLHKPVPQ
jgi:hypothetical protein